MSRSTSVLQTGKGLLRLLKTPRPSKELASKVRKRGLDPSQRSKNAIIQFVSKQIRSETSNAQKMLQDFHRLRSDLAERAKLHAMDTGAEEVLTPKEMSRRAAARAGLQLPQMDEGFNDTSGK